MKIKEQKHEEMKTAQSKTPKDYSKKKKEEGCLIRHIHTKKCHIGHHMM